MVFDREFLTGTVGVLILSLLAEREMYGYEILKEAERRSASAFQLKEGTLYPALHRLEQQGWITAEWKETDLGRSAKFYSLTREGKRQLERELESWHRLSSAVGLLLKRA